VNAGEPRVIAVCGLAWEARIAAGVGVHAIAGGVNADRLRAALELEIASGASAIMSFGIAGGLVSNLKSGAWIVGRAVVTRKARWVCDDAWTAQIARRLPGACVADLAGVDRPAGTPFAKRALHDATRAVAVDTESHIAARIAAAHRLPFAAFRVVVDPLGRKLPAAATTALGHEGAINRAAVVRSLVRAPAELSLLMRTAIDARTAFRALSRGRRLLGLRLAYPDSVELERDVM
jgi:adenosylhomocysteine nucleosidase